CMQGTGLWTF
nr:immunoglobulin light chain junction region [Macaca mulatta]MOW12202.1 immunoglobulin light chain junction region [Macaca mulatta]MOW53956.1 immunoglobulin light chain junction region [Macaca mulatta]